MQGKEEKQGAELPDLLALCEIPGKDKGVAEKCCTRFVISGKWCENFRHTTKRGRERKRFFLLRWPVAAGVPIESSSLKSQRAHTHTAYSVAGVVGKVLRGKEVRVAKIEEKTRLLRSVSCDVCKKLRK